MRPAPAIIITATTMSITTTEAALLRLLAWLSPAFPTGGFAYSHGIEWAVEAGDIPDETSLRDWLEEVLAHGAGRSDAILLHHAHRAAHDPDALAVVAELAEAAGPCRERRKETVDQGSAFLLAVAAWEPPHPTLSRERERAFAAESVAYPVAVGALAGRHGIDAHAAGCAYLQAFTANLISAAVRLVPLGQSAGLRVLASLETKLLQTATEAAQCSLDDLGGCAFRSDLAAMRHETQYTRLFRS
jgi:urease accessory protein